MGLLDTWERKHNQDSREMMLPELYAFNPATGYYDTLTMPAEEHRAMVREVLDRMQKRTDEAQARWIKEDQETT